MRARANKQEKWKRHVRGTGLQIAGTSLLFGSTFGYGGLVLNSTNLAKHYTPYLRALVSKSTSFVASFPSSSLRNPALKGFLSLSLSLYYHYVIGDSYNILCWNKKVNKYRRASNEHKSSKVPNLFIDFERYQHWRLYIVLQENTSEREEVAGGWRSSRRSWHPR